MSKEVKLTNDKIRKIKKIWSIILFVEIILCSLSLIILATMNLKIDDIFIKSAIVSNAIILVVSVFVLILFLMLTEGFKIIEEVQVKEETVPVEEVLEEPQQEVKEESEEDDEETVKLLKMCSYTFEAKLILAEPEMKDFYREIVEFALSYGVKVVRSAKRERIYLGRKLFANLTFSGKKLVVAMALNPSDYVDSKYKFKDMSETKKFADTPFVMKVTSGLKVRHIKELLTVMFSAEGLDNKNLDIKLNKIPTKSKKTLIKEGLIKVNERKINN